MERLRFDPYASASSANRVRHIGYSADSYSQPKQRSAETVSRSARDSVVAAAVAPTPQIGLARAFIIPQESIYPQYEVCEGWHKGTIFVSLDKPLEGVTPCGRR